MSAATAAEAREFACARCEMTSRWTRGLEGADAPPHWLCTPDGSHYCLACRRELAVEEVLESAGDAGIEARAKLRSAAVVEFEIVRDPDRTEGEIARSARTSIGAVRKARKRLEAA